MQGESFHELGMGAREAIKLRTVGQGGESGAQVDLCVAIEVPLADEPAEAGKDGEGDDLTRTERGLRSWPHFRGMGVAEVVRHDVECRKEGVLRSTMRSRFLSLRDR